MRRALVVMVVGACGGGAPPPVPTGSATSSTAGSPPTAPTLRVDFGDCAATTVAFVSGPMPLPFASPAATSATPAPRDRAWDDREVGPPAEPPARVDDSSLEKERHDAIVRARQARVVGGLFGGARDGAAPRRGIGVGPRSDADPTVTLGTPTSSGEIDPAIVRRYLKRNIQKILYCYQRALLTSPELQGELTTTFGITSTGAVAHATARGVDPAVASCVADVIAETTFPKPPHGNVDVTYPMTLRRPGALAAASAPMPARPLFQPNDDLGGSFTPPKVGAANPLRAHAAALAACLRASPAKAGVVLVELVYAGTVTSARALGVDDPTTNQCVVGVARQIRRDPAAPGAGERCPLAFGEQPLTALSAIDVTASGASSTTPEVIPPDALLVTHPPRLVRATDDARMATVITTWYAVLAAGDDLVLAAKRGDAWQLLRPLTFPIVPVPFGTGGRWAPLTGAGDPTAPIGDAIVLSILVDATDVWVGFARDNELTQIACDEDLVANLRAKLATYKQSHFREQQTIEIAGADDATWGAVVTAIEAAEASGFHDWTLTVPALLRARPSL